jgi:hypothetical protein
MVLGIPEMALAWLAGGHDKITTVSLLFLFWPGALMLTIITLSLDNARRECEGRFHLRHPTQEWRFWIPGPITAIWLGFYFLPIIMNLGSKLCWLTGWETTAKFLFTWRWASRPIILASTLLVAILVSAIAAFIQWLDSPRERPDEPMFLL